MFNQHYVNYGQINAFSLKTNGEKKIIARVPLMFAKGLSYFQTYSTHSSCYLKKKKIKLMYAEYKINS